MVGMQEVVVAVAEERLVSSTVARIVDHKNGDMLWHILIAVAYPQVQVSGVASLLASLALQEGHHSRSIHQHRLVRIPRSKD